MDPDALVGTASSPNDPQLHSQGNYFDLGFFSDFAALAAVEGAEDGGNTVLPDAKPPPSHQAVDLSGQPCSFSPPAVLLSQFSAAVLEKAQGGTEQRSGGGARHSTVPTMFDMQDYYELLEQHGPDDLFHELDDNYSAGEAATCNEQGDNAIAAADLDGAGRTAAAICEIRGDDGVPASQTTDRVVKHHPEADCGCSANEVCQHRMHAGGSTVRAVPSASKKKKAPTKRKPALLSTSSVQSKQTTKKMALQVKTMISPPKTTKANQLPPIELEHVATNKRTSLDSRSAALQFMNIRNNVRSMKLLDVHAAAGTVFKGFKIFYRGGSDANSELDVDKSGGKSKRQYPCPSYPNDPCRHHSMQGVREKKGRLNQQGVAQLRWCCYSCKVKGRKNPGTVGSDCRRPASSRSNQQQTLNARATQNAQVEKNKISPRQHPGSRSAIGTPPHAPKYTRRTHSRADKPSGNVGESGTAAAAAARAPAAAAAQTEIVSGISASGEAETSTSVTSSQKKKHARSARKAVDKAAHRKEARFSSEEETRMTLVGVRKKSTSPNDATGEWSHAFMLLTKKERTGVLERHEISLDADAVAQLTRDIARHRGRLRARAAKTLEKQHSNDDTWIEAEFPKDVSGN